VLTRDLFAVSNLVCFSINSDYNNRGAFVSSKCKP